MMNVETKEYLACGRQKRNIGTKIYSITMPISSEYDSLREMSCTS
jgi:hypothetical protein